MTRHMCGIVGYFGDFGPFGEQMLRSMVGSLAHRGPDGQGASVHGEIAVGAARLSLLDFDGGHQPMMDGPLAIVFNGEIYNHEDLRQELQQAGVRFTGRSDTEVLLQGFRKWGSALFERLEGMFAIAVRDGPVLHLVRDPFGMKPIVFWISPENDALTFGSEIKALLRCPSVTRNLNPTAFVEYLVFGHTIGSRTLLDHIHQVPPGTHVTVERQGGQIKVTKSAVSQPQLQEPPEDRRRAADQLTEMLRESVARRLHADEPVALYLSGGLDSTVLAALRPDRNGSRSFVVADGKDVADLHGARSVAAALQLEHSEVMVPRAPPSSWVVDAIIAMEAPFLPSIALISAPRVRQSGKAALCGEGSDELFCGYPPHSQPELYLQRLEERAQRLLAVFGAAESSIVAPVAERIRALRLETPQTRSRAVYEFLLNEVMPNKHLTIWDRCAMAASLEVRMPYLDRRVRDFALSVPPSWSLSRKALIADVAQRVLPGPLVNEILNRTKSAAPSAIQATHYRLRKLLAAAIPLARLRNHPLRQLTASPSALVMIDTFLLAFVARDGRLPQSFSIETMYSDHDRELRVAHQLACDALFGATGAML